MPGRHHHHHRHHHNDSVATAQACGWFLGAFFSCLCSDSDRSRGKGSEAPSKPLESSSIQELVQQSDKISILNLITEKLRHKPELVYEYDAEGRTPLMLAAIAGKTELIVFLLGFNIPTLNLTSQDKSYPNYTALHYAILHKRKQAALLLLAAIPQFIKAGTDLVSVIHLAARYGDAELMQAIHTTYPGYLNELDGQAQTAIMHAAMAGNKATFNYLFKLFGIKLDASTQNSTPEHNEKTLLHHALAGGHSEIALSILPTTTQQDLIHRSGPLSFAAIHYAAQYGSPILISNIATLHPDSLNLTDLHGQSALTIAVKARQEANVIALTQIKGILLEDHKNDNSADQGKTALNWATEIGDKNIIILLLHRGMKFGKLPIKINKNCDAETRRLLKLQEYIQLRETQDEYKKKINFFGYEKTFGFCKTDKILAASEALQYLLTKSKDCEPDLLGKKDILTNGDLGSILKGVSFG